ncbi:hypothetical protein LTR17_001436 [Elasticomyces elasticus]|nr:hypothetical protein LTR17_001436 [Elasticomyces elasticus]
MAAMNAGNVTFLNGTQATGAIFECASSLLECPSGLSAVRLSFAPAYISSDLMRVNNTIKQASPDPDIAGIGVVLSFIVVAILSFIIYVICMVLAMINTTSLNPMDKVLREGITRFMSHRIKDETKEIWLRSLTKVLLGLSDQQLIACLAVLIVAIIKLADGSITVYHFTICSDLAWCSIGVHDMTLGVLNSYFRRRVKTPERVNTLGQLPDETGSGKSKRRRLPLMTTVRMILMTVCAILLLFCLVVEGYRSWYDVFACPANCARKDLLGKYGGIPGFWSTFSIILLLIHHPMALMYLTNTGVRFARDVRFKHMKRLDAKLKPNTPPDALRSRLYAAIAQAAKYLWWCYVSIAVQVVVNLIFIVLGVKWIMEDRELGHAIMEWQKVENAELDWGFGQLVPLIFCILPFIAAGESYWDEYLARRGGQDESDEELPESDTAVKMSSISGALQSEPEAIESSSISIHSNASGNSTLPAGDSSAVEESSRLLGEGRGAILRRSTFPINGRTKLDT